MMRGEIKMATFDIALLLFDGTEQRAGHRDTAQEWYAIDFIDRLSLNEAPITIVWPSCTSTLVET